LISSPILKKGQIDVQADISEGVRNEDEIHHLSGLEQSAGAFERPVMLAQVTQNKAFLPSRETDPASLELSDLLPPDTI